MGSIIIKNKGHKEIYLTRYYNPFAVFDPVKDDVGFNDYINPFSDYCFDSTCGSWQNDNIKIISLPDKGRLFYLTNPDATTPIYSTVIVGQIILIRDLIDKKILKFNGEGSFDNQYIGNYLTSFTIERFCGIASNNQNVVVKLNLIETRVSIHEAYGIIIPQTCVMNSGGVPENYTVICNGSNEFVLSDGSNIGVDFGFIRMVTNGATSVLFLTKQNGTPLNVGEIVPITTYLKASLINSIGPNPPSAYPFGYPSEPLPANYVFEYSVNGINGWQNFLLYLTA